ncbi:DEAD/DEAH box helicase [Myxococcus stipitatus DSM 14675]|uniref:DEAD/DEAH box helicase n=1 Tax=Myxococcus stipitatus (strain DSM 14675 / JCM 12634 / Mx s8) TaxID=1278073 RepID=L7UC42_MYXSD|nr:DEAD/DEAH box helicase [Myxococcus stipitatus]AGC45648.1 DEAD/DEAH box helicase [Myxococcus stipitatus DSM 14675]
MSKHYQFDAYQAYHALQGRYADFLLDVFGVRPGPLANVLRSHWSSDSGFSLFAPLLVQAAFPFRPGKTLTDLQAVSTKQRTIERPLHPKTVSLLKKAGIDYPLFEHQVDTIRAASHGKTVVLSAGTGSGKTEAFVIPLIDRLFWDHEEGRDDLGQPGVRAVVVYPLNALVNNQVDRMLAMLGGQDEINFAYYTSRLKDSWRSAKNSYERRGKLVPPKCQIIDRATLRGLDGGDGRPKGPPHVLVTNFSMLEYMLIRPSDRTIFEPENLFYGEHPRLKMMVLDEAHVYAGAQAAEIHMLLRRAAQRFGTTLEAVQGFATSATLAQEESEGRAVLDEYASRMFAKKSNVKSVEGRRYLPEEARTPRQVPELRPPATLAADQQLIAADLRTLKYEDSGNPSALLRDAALANTSWKACEALGLVTEAERAQLPAEIADCPALLLHHVYATHPRLIELRKWLFEQKELPDIDQVAVKVYGPADSSEQRRRATDALLRLGSLARHDAKLHPFIPIRMHALVRAPTGVWVDPRPPETKIVEGWPWGAVTSIAPSGAPDETPRAQLGVCAECGAPYLVAYRVGEAKELRLEKADNAVRLAVRPKKGMEDVLCVDGTRVPVEFRELGAADRHGRSPMSSCLQCNTVATRLRPLLLSPRAALGAVVDMVYPHLGEMPPSTAEQEFRPGGGRRLLTFSDSRQEAARIAAVVESTHDTGVNRQLIVTALRDEGGQATVKELARTLGQNELLLERAASRALEQPESLEYLGLLSIYEELARPPSRANTLETLGIVEVVYPNLPPCPNDALPYFGSDMVWKDFIAQLLDFARSRGVVIKPSTDEPEAEEKLGHFLPNTIGNKLVWSTAEDLSDEDESEAEDEDVGRDIPMYPRRHPETGRMYDYTARVRERLKMPDSMGVDSLLSLAWIALTQHSAQGCKWLRLKQDKLQIDLSRLELRLHEQPPLVDVDSGRVYFRSVGGVVPVPKCPRALSPMSDDARTLWAARHSVRRILEDPLLGLHSVEHTAQIGVDSLEGEESAFRRGERNLLASSTTLEMGVDIGGLTFVMMTNVPPSPANYWQRAGRAGRRADGSSMVLTLALNRPHDQLVFTSPRRFLHSEMTPPQVRLDASPLLLRHVNASLLAAFFEEAVERDNAGSPMRAFGTVDEFLFRPAIGGGGMDKQFADKLDLHSEDPLAHAFERWLDKLDDDSSVAPQIRALTQGTILATYSLSELAASCSKALARAVETVSRDYKVLKEQRERELQKGESARDETFLAALSHQERVLLIETLIACLARNGFLPRFGFPLDIVHLDTKWKFRRKKDKGEQNDDEDERKQQEEQLDLRMERALDIALSEYAPGSEIIAGKKLHRVAGVVRNWLAGDETSVVQHFYLECEKCGHFGDHNAWPRACEICGHPTVFQEEALESATEATGRRRRKKKATEDAETPLEAGEVLPSRVRRYMRPSGFAVKAGRRPRRVGSEIDRMPSPRVTVRASNSLGLVELLPAGVIGGFTANSTVFVRSEGRSERPGGPGFGFAICQRCGFAEPEESFEGSVPEAFVEHDRLRGFRPCEGRGTWRHAVLGTSITVDAFRLRLTKEFRPTVLPNEEEAFFHTFAAYLQLVAARRLQIDPRALHGAVAMWQDANPRNGHDGGSAREAVVYEPSGSGMLRHLMDDPVALLRDVVTMIEKKDEAQIIRFDTQFLAARGMLRVDLLRAHFLDPARKMLLDAANPIEKHRAAALRGRGPMLAAIELVEDTGSELGLQATEIAGDALEAGGLLRSVLRRVLDAEKHVPQLLLSRLPDASGKNDEDAVVAVHLRRLIESGMHIRIAAPADRKVIGEDVWQLLSIGPTRAAAIGGVPTTGSEGPRFGSAWLDGCIPIEAKPEAAKEAWSRFAERWGRGQPVTVADLTPNSPNARPLVEIAKGVVNPDLVYTWRLIRSQLGELNQLGRVTRLAYNDRHLGKSAIALWMLGELLQRFAYAPNAEGKIWTRAAEGYDGQTKTSDELFKLKKAPGNLGPKQSEMLAKWCSVEAGKKGLDLRFERRFELEHPRKLVVEFAPGGKHSSLKVLFDSGLDWAECKSVVGPWTQGPFQTRTTHVSIYLDLPVGNDLASLGV